MNPMIEAAARAIFITYAESRGLDGAAIWNEWPAEMRHTCYAQATAALRAMMEVPVTDGMYGKWMGGSPPFTQDWRDSCNRDWRALLGAIVEE